MKKNFFKKLSFVLALAMIVTALAPAAGVFAAAKPKLNSKDKTLFLSVDGKDEFDFNIANKKSGWSYKWTSANKKVATVNAKNGVTTAVGAGKTSVSVVIKDKKGEEVTTLKASVLVRDNIKELTITNLPKDDKLAVDASNDFNRSYKTVAGLTKGSQAITRWVVTDKDGKVATTATIDDKGVFTASEAGEYTITANAFQSKAKYTSWLADSEKYASYVTATATYKVTVAPSIVDAKQTTLKKFNLTFDTAVKADDVKKNLAVSYLAGSVKIKALVDGVSMDDTGKVATVTMYDDFVKGSTYVAEYPELGSAQFVAATNKVEDVVDIAILTKTAQISKEQKLDIALYNKDGVNIADDNLLGRVTVEKAENSSTTSYLVDKKLYMNKIGDTINLTATFHTYNWVEGKEVGNVTATGVVTCVEIAKDQVGNIEGWSVQTAIPTNFKTPKTQVFKNGNANLYVLLKGKSAGGDTLETANYTGHPTAARGTAEWKYTSSNPSVLMISQTGDAPSVYGVSEGMATVVVSYDGVQVGSCDITVIGARKLAMAKLSADSLVLSKAFSDATTISVEVKDQLGDDYGAYSTEVVANGNHTLPNNPVGSLTFDGHNVSAGSYGYTVKIKDNNSSTVISLNFNVTVQDPSANLTLSHYKIEADKVSYEVKSDDAISNVTAQLKVYKYNSAGMKIDKLQNGVADLVAAGYDITVKNPDGATVTGSAITAGNAIINGSNQVVLSGTKTVSGMSVAATEKKGTWLITATSSASGAKSVNPVSFEIKNTQPKVEVSIKRNVTDKVSSVVGNEATIIDECISFVVGDKTLHPIAGLVGTAGIAGPSNPDIVWLTSGKDISLKTLKLYEPLDNGGYVEHEVNMNGMVISIK